MMHDALAELGRLEDPMNHDLRSETPKVSRRTAYTNMAKRSVDYHVKNLQKRITNQYYLFVIRAISAIVVLPTEVLETAAGLRPGPNGTLLFSPEGLSYESGFSAGYGSSNPKSIANLAIALDAPLDGKLMKRAKEAYEAYSHFLYLGNDSDGYRRLNKVEWIT